MIKIILILLLSITFIFNSCSLKEKQTTKETEKTGIHHQEHVIYTCPMHPQIKQDKEGNCPICGMKLVPQSNTQTNNTENNKIETTNENHSHQHQKVIYTCPMHPQIKQDKPGDCPICGMKLVPQSNTQTTNSNINYIEHEHKHGLTDTQTKTSSINIIEASIGIPEYIVDYKIVKNTFQTIAYTEINQSFLYNLTFFNSTFIIEDTFNTFEGQFIKKNQPLLKVKSFEIEQTKRELMLSPKFSEIIKQKLNFLRSYSFGVLTSDNVVRAPFDCVIVKKYFNNGSTVEPNQPIYTFSKDIWIVAEVPISYYNQIYPQRKVKIKFNNEEYFSFIETILFESNKDSRVLRVKINYPKELNLKSINIPVEVKFEDSEEILAVPYESVLNYGNKKIVFKKIGENKYKPVRIEVGRIFWDEDQGYYEVKNGINKGEIIAKDGYFLLDSETRIKGLEGN